MFNASSQSVKQCVTPLTNGTRQFSKQVTTDPTRSCCKATSNIPNFLTNLTVQISNSGSSQQTGKFTVRTREWTVNRMESTTKSTKTTLDGISDLTKSTHKHITKPLFDTTGKLTKSVTEGLKKTNESITDPLSKTTGNMTDTVTNGTKKTKKSITDPLSKTTGNMTDTVTKGTKKTNESIFKPLSNTTGNMTDTVTKGTKKTNESIFKPLSNTTGNMTDTVTKGTQKTNESIFKPLSNTTGNMTDTVTKGTQKTNESIFKPLSNTTGNMTDTVTKGTQKTNESIFKPLSNTTGNMTDTITKGTKKSTESFTQPLTNGTDKSSGTVIDSTGSLSVRLTTDPVHSTSVSTSNSKQITTTVSNKSFSSNGFGDITNSSTFNPDSSPCLNPHPEHRKNELLALKQFGTNNVGQVSEYNDSVDTPNITQRVNLLMAHLCDIIDRRPDLNLTIDNNGRIPGLIRGWELPNTALDKTQEGVINHTGPTLKSKAQAFAQLVMTLVGAHTYALSQNNTTSLIRSESGKWDISNSQVMLAVMKSLKNELHHFSKSPIGLEGVQDAKPFSEHKSIKSIQTAWRSKTSMHVTKKETRNALINTFKFMVSSALESRHGQTQSSIQQINTPYATRLDLFARTGN